MAAEERFRAMGSDCHVLVVGGRSGTLDLARNRIDDLERRWSRFIDSSEISRLNASGGKPTIVSPETFELIARGVDAWRMTAGRFDPTVLGAMLANGYDRTFTEMEGDRDGDARGFRTGAGEIALVTGISAVTMPAGVGFDPGGIGKGYAADLVVEELLAAGAAGACVNVGGDLRVAGEGPDGDGWTIEIEHPFRSEPCATLTIDGGAVATTTRVRRRWRLNGVAVHHLIDPRTGKPANGGLASVSVVAGEAWWAEVWAKAAFVAGAPDVASALADAEVLAFLIDDSGDVRALEAAEVPA